MSHAIVIKADNKSGDPIRRLWDDASEFEAAPSMQGLNYAPHITLAVYETIDPDALFAAFDATFAGCTAFSLTFDRMKIFEAAPLVLWAAPRECPALRRVAIAIHQQIDPALCHPHYRPGAWRPHCTLATDIRSEYEAAARDFVKRRLDAFEVSFDVAECVEFPPVRILRTKTLSPAAKSGC